MYMWKAIYVFLNPIKNSYNIPQRTKQENFQIYTEAQKEL